MAEMLTYGTTLTSMTQGRGSFRMEMEPLRYCAAGDCGEDSCRGEAAGAWTKRSKHPIHAELLRERVKLTMASAASRSSESMSRDSPGRYDSRIRYTSLKEARSRDRSLQQGAGRRSSVRRERIGG